DDLGYSHALLGIFDPLADVASNAVSRLNENDVESYRQLLQPTVPLARHIFRAPTQYYKTGVVFLAWLNGFQEHFVMLKGAQSDRNLYDFSQTFQLADQANILVDPERACFKMKQLLAMYGL
ncbi:dihydrodipicolinate synthase family protein, partial [Endozoicomonas sp. SESOKO3]|uniref:dihydrodipicolinate synthase family protein n=1 Tax=Endozoicomonas sp. SESOKO3 TaxID=2828744 RepID=UPI00214980B9